MSDALDALRAAEAAIREGRGIDDAASAAADPSMTDASATDASATGQAAALQDPAGTPSATATGDGAKAGESGDAAEAGAERVAPRRPVIVTPARACTRRAAQRTNAIVLAAPAAAATLGALTARLAMPGQNFPPEPAASHATVSLGGVRITLELGARVTAVLLRALDVSRPDALLEDPMLAALAVEAVAASLIGRIEQAAGVAVTIDSWRAGPMPVEPGEPARDRLEWVVDSPENAPERAALIGARAMIDLVLEHLGRAAAEAGAGVAETEAALSLPTALRLPSTVLTLAELSALEPGDVVFDRFDRQDLRLCVCSRRWRVALEEDKRVTIQDEANPTEAAVEAELSTLPEMGAEEGGADLADAELAVSFELARTTVPVSTARRLAPGYVFSLDRSVSAEVDIIVSNRRFGRGRIVEIDGEIGVEIVRIG